jgi:hypothetical protein
MRASRCVFGLLLAGCASQSAAPPRLTEKLTQIGTSSQAETLGWLKTEIARVRSTPSDQSYMPADWRHRDVSPLIGSSRQVINDALGQPDVCPTTDGTPCPFGGEVVYRLFRLYEQLGGGPHLVLSFGRGDTCSGARWVGTK